MSRLDEVPTSGSSRAFVHKIQSSNERASVWAWGASILHRLVRPQSRMLLILEIATLMVLVSLALAFARPQLEGWGVLEAFRVAGIEGGFKQFFHGAPARMLEPVPLAIAWVLGHGAIWALALVYGFELAAKYVTARWAVSPLVRGANGWVVATLAAVMLPWAGAWHGHNMAQQLAAVFMLVALGASLRLRERVRIGWLVLGTAGVLLSLLTYEALVLCALALPLVVLFSSRGPLRSSVRPAVRSALPAIFGIIIYSIFYYLAQSLIVSKVYHEILLSGPQALKTPMKVLKYLYSTTYVDFPLTTTLLVAVVAWLVGSAVLALPDRKERKTSIVAIAVTFVMLPLLSLIYAVNFYFLSDIERLGFPLGFGFLLLCVTVLARFSPPDQRLSGGLVVVAAMLVWAGADAYKSYRPYELQRNVLDQTKALVRESNAHFVLLRDWTGTLGDYYTFLVPGTLQQAMGVEGVPINIGLCTPEGVDRVHPQMRKFQGGSGVPRCETLPPASQPQLVLDLRLRTDKPLGPPVVTSLGIVYPPSFATSLTEGSDLGKEGDGRWWINAPRAIIAVENKTKTSMEATWSGTFIRPPCPGKFTVTLTVDGKSVTYPVDGPVRHSFTTTVPGDGKKLASLQVSGIPCKPEATNSRTFYAGIVDMTAR